MAYAGREEHLAQFLSNVAQPPALSPPARVRHRYGLCNEPVRDGSVPPRTVFPGLLPPSVARRTSYPRDLPIPRLPAHRRFALHGRLGISPQLLPWRRDTQSSALPAASCHSRCITCRPPRYTPARAPFSHPRGCQVPCSPALTATGSRLFSPVQKD